MRDFEALVDRHEEVEQLRALFGKGTPQLVLMHGRRGVGKTFLLNRVWPGGVRAFYFTASETTPVQNRVALLGAFGEWAGEAVHADDYPTWRAVFRLLLEHRSPEPMAITVDEFQYLGENARDLKAVASELNAAWEARRAARPLVFVIAGSAVRTLETLNDGGSPLYGRFAWQSRLRPLNYWFAGELAGFTGAYARACAYGVFGGTPRFLSAIDSDLSLEENIIGLMLSPSGEVRELVRTALWQEQGLRDIPKYVAILRAIGQGRTDLNGIAQQSGLEVSPALREKVERLIQLDYIRAGRNLEARAKEPYRYKVCDPAMRFYYDLVAPHESALATQRPAFVWERHIEPYLDTYMGHLFEPMVEEAYYRLQPKLSLPLVREWGRWEGVDRNRQAVEIDVASALADGRVLSGAIKWSRKPVDGAVHTRHLVLLDRLAESGLRWAHEARNSTAPLLYVASNGFTERFRQAAVAGHDEVYLWSLDELYQPVE